MNETTKLSAYRRQHGYARYLQGHGIDIGCGQDCLSPMHIKLSTPRKLLWHYRVATPTIIPVSKELPDDDHTTGGPCHA